MSDRFPSWFAVLWLGSCLALGAGCDDGGGGAAADGGARNDVSVEVDAAPGDAAVEGDAAADAAPTPRLDAGLDAGADAVPDAEPDAIVDAGPRDAFAPREGAPPNDGVYALVDGCFAVEGYDGDTVGWLGADGEAFTFGDDEAGASRFLLRASDLGTYLLYDAEGRYFVAAEGDGAGRFTRAAALESDITLLDDTFVSPAEWVVEVSSTDPTRFQLRQRSSGRYLTLEGTTPFEVEAAHIAFFPREDCATFPELTVDAVGVPEGRAWPDGDLYGIAEVHSHMFTNAGFGGGNIFHGAPFHPLGVEHALPDCTPYHGEEGRRDLVGLFFDGGDLAPDVAAVLPVLLAGEADDFVHHTEGYPLFTEWPNPRRRATHQAMYYRWLERAWRSGLRLVVQHATGNSVLCEFAVGVADRRTRYSCNDMVTVDKTIEGIRALERYVDAQWGGPGEGWLRVVETPAQAREVIAQGKLAIVLGIEISNLFDCFLTPPEGFERCTADDVRAKLDRYYDLGVRVVFPVHKFDNGFGPGDGDDGVIELGNFVNSGLYNSQVEDCPYERHNFDSGGLTFAGLNQPREEYLVPPIGDFGNFVNDPIGVLRPFFGALLGGSEEGDYCQSAEMTELGETLLLEMMRRGMMPDIAHLPQRSTVRALEMLQANDYPALSTHGNTHDGILMRLGGVTQSGIGGCGNPNEPGRMVRGITARSQARAEAGAHPGTPLGFDLNGFAGARGPRFGEQSVCGPGQANPVEYPFFSHDGSVEFLPPQLGERAVEFNTEGFLHIGLLPELIEDARRDGATDEDLEPLFRSAETVVRMWERAEARAAALRGAE